MQCKLQLESPQLIAHPIANSSPHAPVDSHNSDNMILHKQFLPTSSTTLAHRNARAFSLLTRCQVFHISLEAIPPSIETTRQLLIQQLRLLGSYPLFWAHLPVSTKRMTPDKIISHFPTQSLSVRKILMKTGCLVYPPLMHLKESRLPS